MNPGSLIVSVLITIIPYTQSVQFYRNVNKKHTRVKTNATHFTLRQKQTLHIPQITVTLHFSVQPEDESLPNQLKLGKEQNPN